MWFGQGRMSDTSITPRHAWQPFTPRGAAAYAAAPVGRLLLVELIVAVMVAGLLGWFVRANWLSVVGEAVRRLPETAAVREGLLQWGTNPPVRLAENRFLAVVVDARNNRTLGRVADLEVSLHDTHLKVASLLGYVEVPYPKGRAISLARADAIPWWGAWEGPLLALFTIGVGLVLLASWLALATLYGPVAWSLAFFVNRSLSLGGSWKLCGAALMPASLVVAFGVFCYGWIGLDLFQLGLVYLLHFVAGWSHLVASLYFLPKVDADSGAGNPFATQGEEETKARPKPQNPFAENR
jgi:hypothetical protein